MITLRAEFDESVCVFGGESLSFELGPAEDETRTIISLLRLEETR